MPERSDDVEPVSRLLLRQDLRALAGDREEELDAARTRVVDAQGPAEEGKVPSETLTMTNCPGFASGSERRCVDRRTGNNRPNSGLRGGGRRVRWAWRFRGSFRPLN
ncbi:MAG: hypothetical protein M0C28_14550 [Candidatus Moduliflexus flocculans]|nr:hypothetical protein [Candidatus Moduliflexus flocculans]